MDSKTRKALVDNIAKRIDTFAEHVGYGDPDVTREEASSYIAEIEEALLTDRAATIAEPDGDASTPPLHMAAVMSGGDPNWLDAALDSVHPKAVITRHCWDREDLGLVDIHRIEIEWPDKNGAYGPGLTQHAVGTGTIRREAILNAVRKAKEAQL